MAATHDPKKKLRWLIWLYFILLVFEGAVRKWALPSLSNQLLLIRDPLVILIYVVALGAGCFPIKNGWMIATVGLAAVTLAASVLGETFRPAIALYGFRTNFLHLPLIFVMGEALNLRDILKFGRWTIWLSIPMALLMTAQFRGGEGHWLNVGAGEGSGQLISALGKVRASGTFSFITGPVLFFPLVAAFLFQSQLTRGLYSMGLVAAGSLSVALASAVAGSRSLLGSVAVEGAGFFLGILFHPPSFARAFRIVILGGITYLGINTVDLFKEATEVMRTRIELASQGAPSIIQRVLSGFNPHLEEAKLFGKGLGVGTNVGAALLGRRGQFLIAENEWHRITGESGLFLGPAYILLRVGLAVMLLVFSCGQARKGNIMPLLFFSAVSTVLVNGQFGPTTILGFAVFGSGCCLAAMNREEVEAAAKAKDEGSPDFIKTRKRARYEAPVHVNTPGPTPPPPRARPAAQPGRWTVRPPGQETKN